MLKKLILISIFCHISVGNKLNYMDFLHTFQSQFSQSARLDEKIAHAASAFEQTTLHEIFAVFPKVFMSLSKSFILIGQGINKEIDFLKAKQQNSPLNVLDIPDQLYDKVLNGLISLQNSTVNVGKITKIYINLYLSNQKNFKFNSKKQLVIPKKIAMEFQHIEALYQEQFLNLQSECYSLQKSLTKIYELVSKSSSEASFFKTVANVFKANVGIWGKIMDSVNNVINEILLAATGGNNSQALPSSIQLVQVIDSDARKFGGQFISKAMVAFRAENELLSFSGSSKHKSISIDSSVIT